MTLDALNAWNLNNKDIKQQIVFDSFGLFINQWMQQLYINKMRIACHFEKYKRFLLLQLMSTC